MFPYYNESAVQTAVILKEAVHKLANSVSLWMIK